MKKTNNPAIKSWIEVRKGSDFPIQNIPFGIFSPKGRSPRPGTIIGDTVIDLSVLADEGLLDGILPENGFDAFFADTLNEIIALGKDFTSKLREKISELFETGNELIRDDNSLKKKVLHKSEDVTMHMPCQLRLAIIPTFILP